MTFMHTCRVECCIIIWTCCVCQDEIPEVDETFWVNLTSVQLMGSQPADGAAPSVRHPGNIAAVTIAENDNAQGIVGFNVARVGKLCLAKMDDTYNSLYIVFNYSI